MTFRVHYKKDFKGTDYIEVGPGAYDGKHWQPDFVFIDEDIFYVAEGIVRKHFPAYDHYGMNSIPEEPARGIVAEWEKAAHALVTSSEAVPELFGLGYRDSDRAEIARFLQELAGVCETFIGSKSSFCILGL